MKEQEHEKEYKLTFLSGWVDKFKEIRTVIERRKFYAAISSSIESQFPQIMNDSDGREIINYWKKCGEDESNLKPNDFRTDLETVANILFS